MLKTIIEGVQYFLAKFWSAPGNAPGPSSGVSFSWEHAVRCECTHFLFSASLGYLAVLLSILIICSLRKSTELDQYTWRSSWLFGLCISVTTHMLIDAYTILA